MHIKLNLRDLTDDEMHRFVSAMTDWSGEFVSVSRHWDAWQAEVEINLSSGQVPMFFSHLQDEMTPAPMVKEFDPDLEALLAEENEIDLQRQRDETRLAVLDNAISHHDSMGDVIPERFIRERETILARLT